MVERGYYQLVMGDVFAGEGIVAVESEDRSVEVVGAGLGDGIDAGARESGLRHVIRRDIHLYLVDRIQGYGLGVGLAAGGGSVQPERVVKDGAIQRKVIVLSVSSGERQPIIG